jgi:glutamine amidotransferase-like uncharacterized protein
LKKITTKKKWAGGVAQGVSTEFKPQYCKKKKKKKKRKKKKEKEKKEKERILCLKNALSFLLDPSQI